MVQLLNSIYLGAATPSDYGKAAGVVELLPFDYYLGAAVPSHGIPTINVLLSGVSPLTFLNAISLNCIKAFGKCEQRKLPKGYTEYDGLVGDGNAYIDLNCTLDQNDEIEVEFTMPATLPNSRSIFGFRNNASSDNIAVIVGSTGSLVVDWNNSDYTPYRFSATPAASTRYKVILNKTGRYLYDSTGTLVASNTIACPDTITTGNPRLFYLGGSPAYGGNDTKFNGTIHRCAVKSKLDLIPCKNASNVAGMYDKVNKVFYQNSTEALGGSAFTVGSAIAPTPDNPIDIVCNNGVIKAFTGNKWTATNELVGYTTQASSGNIVGNSNYNTSVPIFLKKGGYSVSYYTPSTGNKPFRVWESDEQGDLIGDMPIFEISRPAAGTNTGTFTIDKDMFVRVSRRNDFTKVSVAPTNPIIYYDGTVETVEVHGKNLFDITTSRRYRTSWASVGTMQAESASSAAQTYGFATTRRSKTVALSIRSRKLYRKLHC